MPPPRTSVSPRLVTRLARLCLALPESYQETAWVGTRWMIRKRTFAHVVAIAGGWPPAYARAAGSLGPLTTPVTVLTVRAAGALYETLRSAGAPYFQPAWGTRWGAHVIGMVLAKDVDWDEVALVLTESYRLLAPRKLAASLR